MNRSCVAPGLTPLLVLAGIATASCLLQPGSAAERNPLIGAWRDAGGSVAAISRLAFTPHTMEIEDYGPMPIERYEIEDGWVYVITGFGDSFAFEIVRPDRICLSGPGDRWCYVRGPADAPSRRR